MKCKRIKSDGNKCNRNIADDAEYCYQHMTGWWNKFTYFFAELLGVKRKTLFWTIIFTVIVFFIQLHITYQYTKILDNLKLKPDIEAEISPYLYKAPFGDYLPLIVTNTGDFTFERIYIFISACNMQKNSNKYYERYELPLLPAHSERVVPFGNKETIKSFQKGNCYPFAGTERSQASFSFNPYGNSTSTVATACGYCLFEGAIRAEYTVDNELRVFEKNISSYFSSPVDLIINVTPIKK